MKKTTLSLLLTCMCCTYISPAYADSSKSMGDLFKGFKKIIESGQSKSQSTNKSTPSYGLTGDNLTVSNAAEYCEKLKTNPIFTNFANTILEIRRDSWLVSVHNQYYLDTEDRLVAQWVKQSVKNDPNYVHNVFKPVKSWVNQCLYDNADPTSNLLFKIEPDFREHSRVNKLLNKHEEKTVGKNARRIVDANGNVSAQKQTKTNLPNFVYSPSFSNNLNEHPHWAALFALAMPEGESVLEKLTSKIPNKIRQAAVQENKQNIASNAKEEKIKSTREKEAAAEGKVRRAEAKRVNEYNNTADGKLYLSYVYYSRVKSCFDVRVGYAAVYLTKKQYNKAKIQAKNIEKKLESQLTENKDALWARAVKSRDEFSLGTWHKGLYFGIENYAFNAARNTCSTYVKTLNSIAINVLGAKPVEKGF